MKKIKCSLSFHRLKLDVVPVFAAGVRDGVYGNAAIFLTPPLLEVDFQVFITAYDTTRSLYVQGGLSQKGPFLAAKTALMSELDNMAAYVDSVVDGDPNGITIAGFVPTKGTSSDVLAPVQVTGVEIKRGSTGELVATCNPQANAVAYGCIMTVGTALPSAFNIDAAGQLYLTGDDATPPTAVASLDSGVVFDFNLNRKKEFLGLTPGVTYFFVFYVNASGVGALSAPVSIMAG